MGKFNHRIKKSLYKNCVKLLHLFSIIKLISLYNMLDANRHEPVEHGKVTGGRFSSLHWSAIVSIFAMTSSIELMVRPVF